LMRPPFDSTRLVICALQDEVAGEIKPAAIPAEAHIAKVLKCCFAFRHGARRRQVPLQLLAADYRYSQRRYRRPPGHRP
jgi:hypothetical protein